MSEDEGCETCNHAVGAGMILQKCRDLDAEKCDSLKTKFTTGDISFEELYTAVRKMNAGNEDAIAAIDYTRELAYGRG
jgi:hypothetical protein|tara:strand:+ start:1606 stop:1839 length:234 start_codon:yes stop_codon:yes gene_type:complete